MEEKYYTPDVSEFCIGLKFYAKQKQNDKSTSLAWVRDDNIYPWEITKDNYGEVFEYLHYGDLRESAVVKYLDKEDIESLGFEAMMDSFNKHIGENQYKATSKKGNFNKLKWLSKHDDKICLHFVDDFKDDGNNNCYVAFTIKNKSELKKVLKMIGYEH